MNKYQAVVTLHLEVEAFDEADAKDAITDTFGPGEDCGVIIKKYEVKKFEPANKS